MDDMTNDARRAAEQVKRYDMTTDTEYVGDTCVSSETYMVEIECGDWVKHEDHVSALREAERRGLQRAAEYLADVAKLKAAIGSHLDAQFVIGMSVDIKKMADELEQRATPEAKP